MPKPETRGIIYVIGERHLEYGLTNTPDKEQALLAFENELRMINYVVEERNIKSIFVESDPARTKSYLAKTLESAYSKVAIFPLIELNMFYDLASEIADRINKLHAEQDLEMISSLSPIEQIRRLDEKLDLEGDWNRMSMRRQKVWIDNIETHFIDRTLIVCGGEHVVGGYLNRRKTVSGEDAKMLETVKDWTVPYKSLPSMLEERGFKVVVVAYANE